MEKKFAFRDKLCTTFFPHSFNMRPALQDELSLAGGVELIGGEGETVAHAKEDLVRFLKSGGAPMSGETVQIRLEVRKSDLEDVCSYKGRVVEVSASGISIAAYDERGLAQALYDLEDEMRERGVPYLKKGKRKNKPLFSPRMAHSSYDYDIFPDGYLQNLARDGFDAVTVYVKGPNVGINGKYYDFNDLIKRAAGYGMDVYAYCVVPNFKHPDDPDAEQVYEQVYSPLFKGTSFKGIVLVGESVEFPSRDPHTTGRHYFEKSPDHIPEGKPSPGWWPCEDYPRWIELVKKTIKKITPGADVIFWTYNWGWAPKEARVALLRALPTDITLMVTFEMFERYPVGDIHEMVCDYTLAFEGPGQYFISEAEVARERGIRLYTQANAGGRTWDFGCMPYEPMPQQWQKRYAALREAHDKYGLVGIMESHHFGVTPSFITRIEKKSYEYFVDSPEKILSDVIGEFSGGETEKCIEAFSRWSEAIRLYPPNDEEQYCAMRVGTAYPLNFMRPITPPDDLVKESGKVRLGITVYDYRPFDSGRYTPHCLRIRPEIKTLRRMVELMREGLAILKSVKNKTQELRYIINLGEYICCVLRTDINVKRLFIVRTSLKVAGTEARVRSLLRQARRIISDERKNAQRSIAFLRRDSFLGYEATMGYAGGEEYVRWKLKHLDYVEGVEIPMIENSLTLTPSTLFIQYM